MKHKKLIYGVLIASLAANLFFAGMLTVLFTRDGPGRFQGPPEQFSMEAAREALSPESRAIVDEIWEDFRRDRREDFRDVFRLRQDMRQILQADDFDADAFDRIFTDLHETGMKSRLAIVEAMREISTVLPADERKNYFRAGMDPRNRRGPDQFREESFREGRRPPPDERDGD